MKFLRNFFDAIEPHFLEGGKLEKLYPIYEATDTIFFTPGETAKGKVHVRDALDLKRMMITVIFALIPCVLMALYNTGLQANSWVANGGAPLEGWQESVYTFLGYDQADTSLWANIMHGAVYFVPVLAVTFLIGGHIEVLFAAVRKHEVNEGFLVTGFLFPLILPPTIPLWQVAVGITFGVIVGKEVFGGTGMNIFNVALTARAFLFFAYPAEISGESPWVAADLGAGLDGMSGATNLAAAASYEMVPISAEAGQALFASTGSYDMSPIAEAGQAIYPWSAETVFNANWVNAFVGFTPGSMGETSTLACLLGAIILITTRVGSWRTMLGVVAGTAGMALMLNGLADNVENPLFGMSPMWHMVVGGWAFGAVFMATDPVSSAFTNRGKLIYGFLIGVLVVLIRVVNPAYPEGMMLAILFMNMFAPLIDNYYVQANIKRRKARAT
ncbi:MAG: NADH:ubiquinone reductase (Na(+)-transporting) subunit B [Myxococcota bacterium]|nr:NADH:ubiquinone reductase (Na(+)-transporting) subunit B [Myxococcota bacterium]